MNIFVSLQNLIERVNEIDKKAKKLSIDKDCSSNPFISSLNKTYAWIEPVKENPQCKYRPKN